MSGTEEIKYSRRTKTSQTERQRLKPNRVEQYIQNLALITQSVPQIVWGKNNNEEKEPLQATNRNIQYKNTTIRRKTDRAGT